MHIQGHPNGPLTYIGNQAYSIARFYFKFIHVVLFEYIFVSNYHQWSFYHKQYYVFTARLYILTLCNLFIYVIQII